MDDLIKSLDDNELAAEIRQVAEQETNQLVDFLCLLSEVNRRNLHLQKGYSSLFNYCRDQFNLSEGSIYRRIQVARSLEVFPFLIDYLRDGSLNLTTASLAVPYLRVESGETLILSLLGKSKRQVEQLLADGKKQTAKAMSSGAAGHIPGCPQDSDDHADNKLPLSPKERGLFKSVSSEEVELSLLGDPVIENLLNRARELLVPSCPDGAASDVLAIALQYWLDHHDPKRQKVDTLAEFQLNEISRYVPRKLKDKLLYKSGYQCTWVSPEGHRCEETWGLEIDHILPWSRGGRTREDNLQVLCRAHNQYKFFAEKNVSADKVAT